MENTLVTCTVCNDFASYTMEYPRSDLDFLAIQTNPSVHCIQYTKRIQVIRTMFHGVTQEKVTTSYNAIENKGANTISVVIYQDFHCTKRAL